MVEVILNLDSISNLQNVLNFEYLPFEISLFFYLSSNGHAMAGTANQLRGASLASITCSNSCIYCKKKGQNFIRWPSTLSSINILQNLISYLLNRGGGGKLCHFLLQSALYANYCLYMSET